MLVGTALVFAMAATQPESGAGPPGHKVEFRWDAPATCPPEDDVRGQVATLLGRDLDGTFRRRVSTIARVRAAESDAGWDLRLFMVTPEGTHERHMVHEDCTMLARFAALAVAISIDPDAAERIDGGTQFLGSSHTSVAGDGEAGDANRAPPSGPVATPTPQAPAAPPSAAPAPPIVPHSPVAVPPSPSPAPALRTYLGFDLGGAAGIVPTGGLSLGGHVTVARRIAAARVRVMGVPKRAAILQGARTTFSAWSVGLDGCALLGRTRWNFPLCLGLGGGRVHGSGGSLPQARDAAEPWFTLSASAGARWSAGKHVGLRFDVMPTANLWRPHFVLDNGDPVYRAPALALIGTVGIDVRLGTR